MDSMTHPCLVFCPYLPPLSGKVQFADWELAPLENFDDRWVDHDFKCKAKTLLNKFLALNEHPIDHPALLCRAGSHLDGKEPTRNELSALRLSLVFAFLDLHPRIGHDSEAKCPLLTAENAQIVAWPIDLKTGKVTLRRGRLLEANFHGYNINDPKWTVRPPDDLCDISLFIVSPNAQVLTDVYRTVIYSLRHPKKCRTADGVRVALRWLEKAWFNTRSIEDSFRSSDKESQAIQECKSSPKDP